MAAAQDGNSAFRAVAVSCNPALDVRDDEAHRNLRMLAYQFVMDMNEAQCAELFPVGGTHKSFCDQVAQEGGRGGAEALRILAAVMQRPIHVWHPSSTDKPLETHTGLQSPCQPQTLPIHILFDGVDRYDALRFAATR